jgi:hypothetical protein
VGRLAADASVWRYYGLIYIRLRPMLERSWCVFEGRIAQFRCGQRIGMRQIAIALREAGPSRYFQALNMREKVKEDLRSMFDVVDQLRRVFCRLPPDPGHPRHSPAGGASQPISLRLS